MMFSRFSTLLLATTALVPLGLAAAIANPLGAQVVGGNASVQGQGTASVTVTQTTDKAIINWNTFNIGANEANRFVQPGSSSIALNRVTGGLGPSELFGTLSANGRIFLVNPDGILVGPGAKIDTAGFLATTHDIANADFMAGRYNFSIPGRPDASVVNQGTITAQNGGFAALVAPGVRNSGTITARLGTIELAAGNAFTLDFYGDKLITLGVSDSIAAQVKDVSTGQPLSSLVSNEGKLKADGGTVELTAVAARHVVDSVINNTGVIEANSIGTHNGMIVLGAATAATKPADKPTQTVKVSGKLSAAGKDEGTKGGTVVVTGEHVVVTGATIDASGPVGGGTVLIGGDVGGGNPNPAVASIPQAQLQPYAVPTASTVTVDTATTIDASAKNTGDGGKVVVWSNGATTFAGSIVARGGAASGDGGFVETSGHQNLSFNGAVDLSAVKGTRGTLLLDPQDVTISNTGTVTVASVQNSLADSDLIVTTGSGAGNGDITVAQSINWANGSSLTLNAFRNISINDGVTIANSGSGNLTLRADSTGTGIGTISFLGTGKIDFSHSAGYVSLIYNPPLQSASNEFVLTNPAIANQLNSYPLDPTAPTLGSVVPRNDDGSTSYNITSVFPQGINFGGQIYTSLWINTNGSISFSGPASQFTPTLITSNSVGMIAPFWADVDTRVGNPIYVNFNALNQVLTVNWNKVGYFDQQTSPTNSFQLQLSNRSNENFDAKFIYTSIGWTAGQASGGTGGLGGTPARAGFTYGSGNATNQFELPQSGNEAALLNLPNTPGNTGVNGVWSFSFLNGLPSITPPATQPATRPLPLPLPITQINQLVSPFDNVVSTPALILASLTPPSSPAGAPSTKSPSRPGKSDFVPPPLPLRAVPGPNGETRSSVPPLGENRFFQNQVLLQLGLNIPDAELTRITQQLGLRIITSDTLTTLGRRAIRFELPGGMSVRDAIQRLEANRLVSVAAPIYHFNLVQADPSMSRGDPAQYMLGELHLDKAHAVASGKGVTIAVIDSEVDKRHTELQGAIAEELDTLDVKEPPHSHGTAMVGAISSHGRLLGVAPGAKILAVRAFSESNNTAEGTTISILKGIEWALSQGARVINMSFAGPRDPSLERAFKAAHDKGVVLVAAAGNGGPKSPPLYPGADPNVIAVTATDDRNRLFRGANQGLQVSVAAPGVDILAAAPEETYQMSTGTSIATAHVSGVVALMLERDPTLKPDDVREILESTATDLGPKGKDTQFGWGEVNPQKALEVIAARLKTRDASSKNP